MRPGHNAAENVNIVKEGGCILPTGRKAGSQGKVPFGRPGPVIPACRKVMTNTCGIPLAPRFVYQFPVSVTNVEDGGGTSARFCGIRISPIDHPGTTNLQTLILIHNDSLITSTNNRRLQIVEDELSFTAATKTSIITTADAYSIWGSSIAQSEIR